MPNPSFEEYIICPNAANQVQFANDWLNFSSSPDYFNVCTNNSLIDVPQHDFGYQIPQEGNAYIGLYNMFYSPPNGINAREYVATELSEALTIGEKYYFSFYYNIGRQQGSWFNCITNNFGIVFTRNDFSNYATDSINNPLLSNFSHYHIQTIESDTANWIFVKSSLVADSAYRYVVFGNFYDDAHTDTVRFYPLNTCLSYWYLDNVCVSSDSLSCNLDVGMPETQNEQSITYSENNLHLFAGNNFSLASYLVYNINGQEVKKGTFTGKAIIPFNYSNLVIVRLITESKTITKKFNLKTITP